MADKIFYKVGDGFQDAHGRAVDEDGTLLGAADPENLSAQAAGEQGESTATSPAPALKAKTAAKKRGKK